MNVKGIEDPCRPTGDPCKQRVPVITRCNNVIHILEWGEGGSGGSSLAPPPPLERLYRLYILEEY